MLAWAASQPSPAQPAQPSCEARNNKLKVVRRRRDGAALQHKERFRTFGNMEFTEILLRQSTGLGWAGLGWAGLVMQRCYVGAGNTESLSSDLCSADEQRK